MPPTPPTPASPPPPPPPAAGWQATGEQLPDDDEAALPRRPVYQRSAPAPAQQPVDLAAEYDTGDSGFDPTLDLRGEGGGQPAAPAPASPPPPPAPRHSATVVKQATDLGLSEGEIAEATPAELVRLVHHMGRQASEAARVYGQRQWQEPPPQPGQPAKPAAPGQPAAPAAPAAEEFDLGFDTEDFHPDLVSAFKKLHGHFAGQIKELQTELGQFRQLEHARQVETATQHVDRLFAGLGADALFGRGTRAELTAESPEYARRRAVLAELDRMKDQPGTLDEKFKKAAQTLFGTTSGGAPPNSPPPPPARPVPPKNPLNGQFVAVPEDDGLDERREQWRNGTVAKPTQRKETEPKGVGRAVKAVAEKLREAGETEFEGDPELPE